MGNTEVPRAETSGMARIAIKARKEKEAKFSNLLHHVTLDKIEGYIRNIPSSTSKGVDNLSRDETLENLDWMGKTALDEIYNMKHRPKPARRVMIPKANGGQRPIGVPTVMDRGIQGVVAKVLEQVYEQDFLNSSYGFRPARGCHNALATVNQALYKENLNFSLEVDIRNFFGSLSHSWMRKFLRHRIADKRILKLIDGWLKSGVLYQGNLEESREGTVQGGSISPLLANIYLHYVLDLWFEAYKHRLKGKARLVRYADDFVIMFEHKEDRDKFLPILQVRFQKFGLAIAEEKTHKTDVVLARQDASHKRRGITFLGFMIYRAKSKSGVGTKIVFKTEGKRLSKAKVNIKDFLKRVRHAPIKTQGEAINRRLKGYFNYFGLPGNSEKLASYRFHVIRMWKRSLSKRSQKAYIPWREMEEIVNKANLARPWLKITYETIGSYVIS